MEDVWLLSEFNSTLDIGGHLGNEAQGSTRFDIGVVAARRMADNDQRKLATHFPVGCPLLKRMINWKANSKGPPAAVNENNEKTALDGSTCKQRHLFTPRRRLFFGGDRVIDQR
jgi:hypothetical protein